MKKTILALFLIFSSSVLFTQVYGTYKFKLVSNNNETNAVSISGDKGSVFIEPLQVHFSDEKAGKFGFVWRSKSESKNVIDTSITLPTKIEDNFDFFWSPFSDKYDNEGSLVSRYAITAGTVRTEASGKTFRYYFEATAEVDGVRLDIKEGVFEYTLLN